MLDSNDEQTGNLRHKGNTHRSNKGSYGTEAIFKYSNDDGYVQYVDEADHNLIEADVARGLVEGDDGIAHSIDDAGDQHQLHKDNSV